MWVRSSLRVSVCVVDDEGKEAEVVAGRRGQRVMQLGT
jgi:hypothetical protein